MLNIVFVNFTTATPKRVLLLADSIEKFGIVNWINWERDTAKIDLPGSSIQAGSSISFIWNTWKKLNKNNFDVIVFDDFRLLTIAYLFSKRNKDVSVIYNRQEIPTITAAQRLHAKTSVPYRWCYLTVSAFENYLAARLQGVISIPLKKAAKQHLLEWNVPYIEIANFPSLNDLTSTTRNLNDTIKFVYAGAVGLKTGLSTYITLIKDLRRHYPTKNIQLLLIGHLSEISEAHLLEMIHKAGCSDSISYRSRVKYKELHSIFENTTIALAFADPEDPEFCQMASGTSRKLFTYMAAGLPILAGGAFSEIVNDEALGKVAKYDDPHDVLEKATMLINNLAKTEEMGIKGRHLVRTKYNWDIRTTDLDIFFNQVIRKSKR